MTRFSREEAVRLQPRADVHGVLQIAASAAVMAAAACPWQDMKDVGLLAGHGGDRMERWL